jgi:hypothetical protein
MFCRNESATQRVHRPPSGRLDQLECRHNDSRTTAPCATIGQPNQIARPIPMPIDAIAAARPSLKSAANMPSAPRINFGRLSSAIALPPCLQLTLDADHPETASVSRVEHRFISRTGHVNHLHTEGQFSKRRRERRGAFLSCADSPKVAVWALWKITVCWSARGVMRAEFCGPAARARGSGRLSRRRLHTMPETPACGACGLGGRCCGRSPAPGGHLGG